MTKREMIKMLNNYHKNKVCINLKSLMRTIRNDKINSEIYKVNKLYVHLIYGKRKAEKVYEDMNNIEENNKREIEFLKFKNQKKSCMIKSFM